MQDLEKLRGIDSVADNIMKSDRNFSKLKLEVENIDVTEQMETHNTAEDRHQNIIGLLASLTTTEKSNLVLAINEVKKQSNENETDVNTHKAESILSETGVHGLQVEKGIWTPTVVGSTVLGSNTYSVQQGIYYKVGNQVTVSFRVVVATKDGTMAGGVRIGNMPFIPATLSQGSMLSLAVNVSQGAATPNISVLAETSGFLSLYQWGVNTPLATLPASAILTGSQLFGTLTYTI